MLHTFFINGLLVSVVVLLHYEMLFRLSQLIPRLTIKHRFRILIGIFGALTAHVFEIWLFGIGYYFLIHYSDYGSLQGNFNGSLMDSVYFSFTNYTSLGYGDIEPIGHVRFLAALEALTGLVLITWSASFMFIEMQKFWDNR